MGTEGTKGVTIHVTGFGKFQGIRKNPSETLVSNLKNYVEKKSLCAGFILGSCTVLDTAGDGALPTLYKVMESGVSTGDSSSSTEQTVWLHLGVNSGALNFAIERQAANEATFCCPDELGWQPQQLPIVLEDGAISRMRKTTCSVEAIQEFMKNRTGYNVKISDDAGRFVCNYVYYHSLRFAEKKLRKATNLFLSMSLHFLELTKKPRCSLWQLFWRQLLQRIDTYDLNLRLKFYGLCPLCHISWFLSSAECFHKN